MPLPLADRLQFIDPFYVMECAKAADEIARSPACDPAQGGRPMIYLNIGEPDFTAPPPVLQAAQACLAAGRTQYTAATGLPALREAISRWYAERFGLEVPARRIVVTAGASAALQLATLALVNPGDQVLLPDPSYPCNRHFVAAAGGQAVLLPAGAQSRFQLDAAAVQAAWGPHTRGVLLASPSNPTGTSIAPDEMRRIVDVVRERHGFAIVDEIYLGLSYDDHFAASALQLGEDVISINSFSKYFSMTGWRLGWMVLPERLVAPVERLAQNLFICASSIAQQAALACFLPESIATYEDRRAAFRARRDFIVPALQSLGFGVPVVPDGAFYVWADVSAHAASSWDFCFSMMDKAHVALTPGRDFGPAAGERYMRLSFANSLPQLEEAVRRLSQAL
ncbi:MAG: pyridoxal phosphate-dependent aminotransferase [Aquincola tertiaricarbonis]|uniref:pyridoxal phosphate-dependent aminotransferase n=1 Tax=Aquincola sp. J276 TaxID=2898432 RepID=UPI002150DEC9|nr:pyridoxal phosphate-dependent aminotransferase [Aquincola sp. J276]MCR5865005.1 pyridoxal phosphate-dependent aminotransferase [Aquincola sp. J276]